jgi:outer membrane protein TolC
MLRFLLYRRWLAVAGPMFIAGCSMLQSGEESAYDLRMPPPLGASIPPMIGGRANAEPAAPSAIRTVGYHENGPGDPPVQSLPSPFKLVEAPVNVETLLRMAEAQNAQIALARKRVDEAAAAECSAHSCQLGQMLLHSSASSGDEGAQLGGGRHAAAAKTWQRRAELAKTTNEVLLDVGNTYFDLLTARRGVAIGHELQKYQESLLHRAEDLAKTDRSATVLVESLRAEMEARHAAESRLRQQEEGAAAKLAYLLNRPPESSIVPPETTLEPVDLIDASPPAEALIARAQASGPGVPELTGLIATIEEGIHSVHPCLTYIPRVARQLQMAHFKLEETQLALDDLRGKLAAGVVEARGAIESGRKQIMESAQQIQHAAETYRLSDLRLTQNAPGASTNDVSQAIRGLEFAHLTHLTAVAAHNKAQLRLILLLGQPRGSSVSPSDHP